jgi:UDP-N-acetylmuramoyl-tripeptide--D-alanyl-D-alanine ligase
MDQQTQTSSFWNTGKVVQAMLQTGQATWHGTDKPVAGITTDSRNVKPGQVFFALRGESFDGHNFLADAHRLGAGLLVIDRADVPLPDGAAALLVDDTLAALHRLTASYRDHLKTTGCRVIAIAGSNGKTTTRNLVHTALSASLKGTQSPKSFNNHIGVPLTLLAAGEHDDFVVVEVGTNHPGEIDSLGRLVRPDAVVVTSIGYEHMEFFKTLEGVAKEEAAILEHVCEGGAVLLHHDVHGWFSKLGLIPQNLPTKSVELTTYGVTSAHQWASDHRVDQGQILPGQAITLGSGRRLRLPLLGRHNADNALAALACSAWAGIDEALACQALEKAQPVDMRLNIAAIGPAGNSLTVVNDAYNANPSSVIAAAGVLCDLPVSENGRRWLVLGDMRELGDEGPELHRMVGREVAKLMQAQANAIDHVVFIGRLSGFTAEALCEAIGQEQAKRRVSRFPAWDDTLADKVAAMFKAGDVVLIKGSRGERLERLVPAISARFKG